LIRNTWMKTNWSM